MWLPLKLYQQPEYEIFSTILSDTITLTTYPVERINIEKVRSPPILPMGEIFKNFHLFYRTWKIFSCIINWNQINFSFDRRRRDEIQRFCWWKTVCLSFCHSPSKSDTSNVFLNFSQLSRLRDVITVNVNEAHLSSQKLFSLLAANAYRWERLLKPNR